jgi:hypothetical protein
MIFKTYGSGVALDLDPELNKFNAKLKIGIIFFF